MAFNIDKIHEKMINTLEFINELFSIHKRNASATIILTKHRDDILKLESELINLSVNDEAHFIEISIMFEDIYDNVVEFAKMKGLRNETN